MLREKGEVKERKVRKVIRSSAVYPEATATEQQRSIFLTECICSGCFLLLSTSVSFSDAPKY